MTIFLYAMTASCYCGKWTYLKPDSIHNRRLTMFRNTIAFITLAMAFSGPMQAEQNQKCLPGTSSFFDLREQKELKHLAKSCLFLGSAYGIHRLTSNVGMPMLLSLVAGGLEGMLAGMSIVQLINYYSLACTCPCRQPKSLQPDAKTERPAASEIDLLIQECKNLLANQTLANDVRQDIQAQMRILEEAVKNA